MKSFHNQGPFSLEEYFDALNIFSLGAHISKEKKMGSEVDKNKHVLSSGMMKKLFNINQKDNLTHYSESLNLA
jgi:hypothetical protein